MKIYIDTEYKCHTTNPDGIFREFDVVAFDGKCAAYIKGRRYVPAGENWVREDGKVFTGEMISPWKNSAELDAAQREYEKQLLAEYAAALNTLGVTV